VDVRHLLLDVWLEDRAALERVEPLWGLLCAAAETAGARVLHAYAHQFAPWGMSGFLLLAESHVSIHTWPEEGYAALDILACGSLDPADVADRFLRTLRLADYRVELHRRGEAVPLSAWRDSNTCEGRPPVGARNNLRL
jgi:S-adenosylmethionine decarboxylase proenzyme